MLKKTVPTLIVAALAAFGTVQIAHAQKNYTDGGDLYGGAHTKGNKAQGSAAKQGKFDPYTEGANKSTKANLNPNSTSAKTGKVDPYTEGAKSGKFDPYTDGAKSGKFDPYTEGTKADKPKE